MFISMQGTWKIHLKGMESDYPRRFVISGAATGNGVHTATVGMAPVTVTGNLWTIATQFNTGAGFQQSDTRIKFPVMSGGEYKFDIETNDDPNFVDWDDLILTCTTPVDPSEYLIYGNVSTYPNSCYYNPCYRGWLVIDTAASLKLALQNRLLADVIKKYYPERIPPVLVNPNPPDPGPFVPLMIDLGGGAQSRGRVANIFQKAAADQALDAKKLGKQMAAAEPASSDLRFERSATIASSSAPALSQDTVAIAKLVDAGLRFCFTSPAPNLTLNFQEYDRSASELAGGAYTGTGARVPLGSAITDSNGNYIFRFNQSLSELITEVFTDVAPGENVFVQYRPDLIVSVPNSNPASGVLFESAPYYNVPNLYRLDLCLPYSEIPHGSICFNGNLIGSLGNVFVGGAQNTAGLTTPAALDRNGYNNHLRSDGKITVHNSQAGFAVDCACWARLIDVKGCLYNLQRSSGDPIIRHYTIRYSKDGVNWQFVSESYLHPKFSKRFLPNYNGDLVGPFPMSLNVDGVATPNVPSYKNIQAEVFFDGVDWEFSNLDRYMQLSSAIYQGIAPGRVFFKVEGYDNAGNLVPGAKDLIGLFIDNNRLGFSLDNVWFPDDGVNIIKAECNLYRMKDAYLNTPMHITFKANDQWGFLDHYDLSLNKCGSPFAVVESIPGISSGNNPGNTDAGGCPGYHGTAELSKFGDLNSHEITYSPDPVPTKKWLENGESYTVYFIGLSAAKRETNGYNSGIDPSGYSTGTQIAVERLP